MKHKILGMIVIFFSTASLAMATMPAFDIQHLKIPHVPARGGVNSETRTVVTTGTLKVGLNIRTAGLFNAGGKSTYVVSLRKGVPLAMRESGTEVASKTVTTDNTRVSVELSVPIATCGDIGVYHLRVSNTSTDNPLEGIVANNFTYQGDDNFSATADNAEYRAISMSGYSLLDFDRGDEKTVSIGSFPKQGTLALKGKWHVPGLLPSFKTLKIYLFRPDGSTAKSGMYYSIHADTSPKLNITHAITASDAAMTGQWKLKIVNYSDSRIEAFNIKKGSDLNPFVPDFESNFKTACGS